MLALELQKLDGTHADPGDFGTVLPGNSSAAKQYQLKNVGSEALAQLLCWVEQLNPDGGSLLVKINGTDIVGTSRETATVLPGLAVNATYPVEAVFATPAGVIGILSDGGRLRITGG